MPNCETEVAALAGVASPQSDSAAEKHTAVKTVNVLLSSIADEDRSLPGRLIASVMTCKGSNRKAEGSDFLNARGC